jgi:hypothetical protein
MVSYAVVLIHGVKLSSTFPLTAPYNFFVEALMTAVFLG